MVGSAEPGLRIWQLFSGAALSMRHWGEEFAVFNPLSGHTHIVDSIAGTLLQALVSSGQLSETELQRLLADKLGFEMGEPLEASLVHLLAQLDEQGLIELVSPC